MLRTRLWMGSLLILGVVGMLVFDERTAPWYPSQLLFQLALTLAACREIVTLLGPERPILPFSMTACSLAIMLASWVLGWFEMPQHAWPAILGLLTGSQLLIFLVEMARFREPGGALERMARTWWAIGYLGLLPAFFAQLRWLYPAGDPRGTTALALAIFVPKGCDIGAYFTGRLIGKHRMTPILSPKKTWEGAIGGLVVAVLVAMGLDRFGAAVLQGRVEWEVGFGLAVGIVGMLGDLAESLLKRDCAQKDASQAVPGFGGVLDVVDSVIFAAPVAYLGCLAAR
jgi:phosphatidate cytidylyltransferase